jgi:hypothetical protein
MCMCNVIMCHYEHSIRAPLTSFVVALGHSPKVPAERCLPDVVIAGSCIGFLLLEIIWLMIKCTIEHA